METGKNDFCKLATIVYLFILRVRVTWPILGICTPLNIPGMAEAKVVKFCVAVGYIKF